MRRILIICSLFFLLSLTLLGAGCSSKTADPAQIGKPLDQPGQTDTAQTGEVTPPLAKADTVALNTDPDSGSVSTDPKSGGLKDPSFNDDAPSFMDDDLPASALSDDTSPLGDEEVSFTEDEGEAGAAGKTPWAIPDPLEPWNRAVFSFNHAFYTYLLDPVVNVYTTIFPGEIRQLVSNFFYNLSTPVRFVSSFLQGQFDKSFYELVRFAVNSTVGFLGFADAATILGIPKPSPEDFGQLLGKWGFGQGVYIVWPFLGAQGLRDTIGLVSELVMVDPVYYLTSDAVVYWTYLGYKWFHRAAGLSEAYHEVTDMALDPYAAMRDFYSQYRWRQVQE